MRTSMLQICHHLFMCLFQLLRGKFEGFLKQLEVGEERLQSCSELAARLVRNKHPQSSAVRETLQLLGYDVLLKLNRSVVYVLTTGRLYHFT